jgi:hypothetical protein
MGGLGNQMFQYALGRRLHHDNGCELITFFEDRYKLANRAFGLENFQTVSRRATQKELHDIGPERRIRRRLKVMLGMRIERHVYREKVPFVFDPSAVDINESVYFIGFWQSYHYFNTIRESLIAEFALKAPTPDFDEALKQIAQSERQTVSVHIRRTDYLNPASGFQPLALTYYHSALEWMKAKVGNFQLFIFSDDPEWARRELKAMGYVSASMVSGTGLSDAEELVLMSKCQHHVIANSSFSWWGAWLNTDAAKNIVAPARWNGSDTSIAVRDLIPAEWKMI